VILLSNPLKEIPNLSERIFAELKSVKMREPSILNFSINDAITGLSELPDSAIIGKAIISDKNGVPARYQAIVYVNNQWYLLVSKPGT